MFEERKLEWMAPMAGGWGGGGGGGGIGAGDPTITNEGTATDGQVLTANGDGTFTFESPTVGGLLTPDGATAVEETDVYPVKAFGASGSPRIFRCTTSGSTVTTTVDHDFEVGQSLVLLRAGANCSVLKPAVANGSLTPGGTPGSTPYRMSFSAGDGNGGQTGCGASDYVETTTGPATITETNYLEAKIPVPYGAASVAVYFAPTEIQTIAISGTPTGGSFTITFAGNTTGAISHTTGTPTDAATVQAALRLLAGLSGVVVSQSGTGTNLTFTVLMTGTTGDPAQMTSTSSLTGGTPVITHATTVATTSLALVTVLETRNKFLASGEEPNGGGTGEMLAATIDNNGGFVRLTVPSGHGFSNGDVINFHSISNPEYNAQHVITGNTGTTLTTATAFGGATASGWYQPGYVTYRYKGTATTLQDRWGHPTDENPDWTWRASIVRPRGNVVVNTAATMLFRSELAKGSRITASAQPTWPSSADSIVLDGDHTMRRCLDFVTINPPAADIPGALFTTVDAVPATNQITLTDAPINAIASSTPYLLAHNDAPAFRAAFAAAEASGRGGTVTADGQPSLFFRKHTLDTNMSNVGSSTAPIHAALRCRAGIENASQPTVSVKLDPNCIVRAHYTQCDGLMEDMTGSETSRTYYHLFHFGGENISIRGGAYEWQIFSGGLTEHNCPDSSHAQSGSWCYDQANSNSINLGAKPQHTLLADCRIDWPNIGASNGYKLADQFSRRKLKARRVQFHYGGSDGDQTFSTNHGDFDVEGCEFWNTRLYGSHALYLGIDRDMMIVRGCVFREVYKNSIQMRGSGGDGPVKNVIISDCFGINTGAIDIGDSTSSNRVHNVAITGCHGFSVSMAEARDVSIVGGTCSFDISEDCDRIKVANLTAGRIVLRATDTQKHIQICNVSVRSEMIVDGAVTDACLFQGLDFENPYAPGTTYNGFIYAWDQCTGSDEYRLKLRSTGGNPSVSSPAALLVRSNITNSAGVYQQLASDTWYYGNTEVQTIAISGTPTGGSFTVTYNGNTSGSIAAGATAATVQTALRLVTGLSAVTVTQSGTGNNLTYRVAMTGVVGDPPQMTSTSSLTGGTPVITHATPVAYPGYDTLVVKIGDSTRYDPDENSYGTVASLTLGPAIKFGGTIQQSQFRDIHIRKTLVDDRSTYFGNSAASAPTLNKVFFESVTFEHTGLVWGATGTVRMTDWGTAVMGYCDIEFFKCKWIYPRRSSSAVHSEVRMNFSRGGQVTFRECEMKCWGSGHEILAPAGSVHLIGNKIQDNESVYTSSTADTFTHIGSGNTTDLASSTSDPVMVLPYNSTALPVPLSEDTIYYRNNSTLKLYPSAAQAAANSGAIDITTANGPVILRFLNVANLAYLWAFEFLGDKQTPDIYGEVRGNLWRGSPAATYAQITSTQNAYQLLPLVNEHLISTDASRTINGINAPGAGVVPGRRDRLINVGSADVVFAHEEVEEQTIAISGTPTGGSFTVTHTGGTTGAISHSTGTPATAATVQTALRLVPGLSLVTVTQSGSGTDLTFTVKMNGWNSDPAQMTSTSSLTGGAPVITHATTVAYTSEWFNRFLNHTSADVTLAANNACELDYDGIQRANRLFAY